VELHAEHRGELAIHRLRNFQRGYTIVDRIGVRFLLDPFTNKPFVRLYTYKGVGGDVNDFLAIKLLKFST
jgi:HK97 family phage major capsid protein